MDEIRDLNESVSEGFPTSSCQEISLCWSLGGKTFSKVETAVQMRVDTKNSFLTCKNDGEKEKPTIECQFQKSRFKF